MAKSIFAKILNIFAICLFSIFLGATLMLTVYSIPTEPIYQHLQKDIEIFQKEGNYWTWAKKSPTRLDGFTDSIMLMNAAYPVDSVPHSAMAVFKWHSKGAPAQTLVKALQNKNDASLDKTPYYRYWHGYLVYLKPLLFISSYHDFRMLNGIFQFTLIAILLILFYQKLGLLHAVAFSLAVWYINPITTAMSLQLSAIFYVTTIFLLLMFLKNDTLCKNNLYLYFFLLVGISTSYLDFLTYPIVGCGILLITYILLNRDDLTRKNSYFLVILYGFIWGFGYLTMWFGKMLVSLVLDGYEVVPNMLSAFHVHTSGVVGAEQMPVNFMMVLHANMKAGTEGPWIWLFSFFVLYLIYRIVKNRRNRSF